MFLFYLSLKELIYQMSLSTLNEDRLRLHFERANMRLNLVTSKCFCQMVTLGIVLMVKMLVAKDYRNVNTSSGLMKGLESKSGDILIYTYKNIPYAKQPVGDLRFEHPEESDVLQEASSTTPIYCPQSSSSYTKIKNATFGQEDCLFLDVYATKTDKSQALPVLIYFHAGRFSYGSKEEYSGDFLLRYNEMIIVIPNYRLGVLGFLHNPDASLPGNLGLWDQRLAMKWVYNNIEYFGGDSQRITIAGHDAGGASVGLHVVSKHSHGYFNAAISVSGTALDPWVMDHSDENADTVSKKLGCTSYLKDELKTCLKNQTFREILDVQAQVGNEMFRPTMDDVAEVPFLPNTPQQLYEEGCQKDVSYLMGIVEEEAFVEVEKEFATAIRTQHLDKIIHHLLYPYLNRTPNFSLTVKAIKYHYLRGVPVPSFDSIIPQMTSMLSDYLYNTPLHTTLKLHGRKTSDTFMYVFNDKKDYYTGFESIKKHLGTGHLGDAPYIFNTSFLRDINVSSRKTKIICSIWGEFIKTNSLSVYNWKKFSEEEMNYIAISGTVKSKVDYKRKDLELWTILVPELQKMDNFSRVTSHFIFKETNTTAWGAAGLSILLGVFCIALLGVVVVTRKKLAQSSIIPINSHKEQVKYNNIE